MMDFPKSKGNEIVPFQHQPKYTRGTNWTKNNVNTLLIWLDVALNQIGLLDYAIVSNRNWIRNNVILGLALSTASGTLSASNISISSITVNFIINIIFTFMSFFIAIMSGYIKVYQIQENLEKYIKIKQDWIIFCIGIITELDLPIKERMDALDLINRHKDKYLELLKSDYDIDSSTKKKYNRKNSTTPPIFEDIEKNPNIIKKDFPSILVSTIFRLQLEFKYGENDDAEEKINIIINSKLINPPKKTDNGDKEYKYRLWQNVIVNYHNGGKWFDGRIENIDNCNNNNKKYDIVYEDGEKEENVSGNLIKPRHKYIINQYVEMKLKTIADNDSTDNNSNWIHGTVNGKNDDGTYQIRTKDNKVYDNVEENIICEYFVSVIRTPKYGQGNRVKTCSTGNVCYGIINKIIIPATKTDKTEEIMYDIITDGNITLNNVYEKNVELIEYCKHCDIIKDDIIDYLDGDKYISCVITDMNQNDTFNIKINDVIKNNVSRDLIKKHHNSECKIIEKSSHRFSDEESTGTYDTKEESPIRPVIPSTPKSPTKEMRKAYFYQEDFPPRSPEKIKLASLNAKVRRPSINQSLEKGNSVRDLLRKQIIKKYKSNNL